MKDFKEQFQRVSDEVQKKVVGQEDIVNKILIGIIAGGNILMEGNPGLGKTVLVKTFGQVLALPFSRIQFTPDLMPVDITGNMIVNKTDGNLEYSFQKGPIFSSLVLADEINRATPKTQSAMLEAMQERTVTVGRETYKLPEPFFVLATENPLEMEGTYRLPEAQLDRFMFQLFIDLPEKEDLLKIIDLTVSGEEEEELEEILTGKELLEMQKIALKTPIASEIKEKVIEIMLKTHPDKTDIEEVREFVKSGASPRGIQAIIKASKVKALSEGRFNVSLDDVKDLVLPCLRHRIFLNFKASANNISADDILLKILERV